MAVKSPSKVLDKVLFVKVDVVVFIVAIRSRYDRCPFVLGLKSNDSTGSAIWTASHFVTSELE